MDVFSSFFLNLPDRHLKMWYNYRLFPIVLAKVNTDNGTLKLFIVPIYNTYSTSKLVKV